MMQAILRLRDAIARLLIVGNEPEDNPLVFAGEPLFDDLGDGADPWISPASKQANHAPVTSVGGPKV